MGWFRRLFGGGGAPSEPVDKAWHFYVKSKYRDEVIDVRVDPDSDLSPEFDGPGDNASHYTCTKHVIGRKSFRPIELVLIFDTSRAFTGDYTVEGGTLVDKDAYEAWQAKERAAQAAESNNE